MKERKTQLHPYIYEPECECGELMKFIKLKKRLIDQDLHVYKCSCGIEIESIMRLERITFQKDTGEEVLWYKYP